MDKSGLGKLWCVQYPNRDPRLEPAGREGATWSQLACSYCQASVAHSNSFKWSLKERSCLKKKCPLRKEGKSHALPQWCSGHVETENYSQTAYGFRFGWDWLQRQCAVALGSPVLLTQPLCSVMGWSTCRWQIQAPCQLLQRLTFVLVSGLSTSKPGCSSSCICILPEPCWSERAQGHSTSSLLGTVLGAASCWFLYFVINLNNCSVVVYVQVAPKRWK